MAGESPKRKRKEPEQVVEVSDEPAAKVNTAEKKRGRKKKKPEQDLVESHENLVALCKGQAGQIQDLQKKVDYLTDMLEQLKERMNKHDLDSGNVVLLDEE